MKLSREDADKLWIEYKKTGSPELKNKLIENYLPVVRYVSERLIERLPNNVQVDDIASSGVFGLMDAVTKFDLSRGVRFETYCIARIRGAILDELRAMDWVPRLTRARANKLEEVNSDLEKRLGRSPTDAEVAKEMNISMSEYDSLLREVSAVTAVSLQRKPLEKDDNTLGGHVELMQDGTIDAPLKESEKKDILDYVKKRLSTKERYILIMYYYDDLTLKEIGRVLGLSESRVCQIHAKLISKLRGYLRNRKLEVV